MQLSSKHLASKPREIGKKGGKKVFHVATTGGFHIIAMDKGRGDGDFETLACGPHVAVARHLAQRDHRDLELNDLEKAEQPSVRAMAHQIPVAETMTRRLRELEGSR